MKTMCLPGYHHNGFVATHALGHMMYVYIYKYDLHVKHKRKKKTDIHQVQSTKRMPGTKLKTIKCN